MVIGMATVNFSVPDDVKSAFDATFKGQNKSAIIADLMRKAVDETKLRNRREEVFRLLTERRSQRPTLSDLELRRARKTGRS